MATWFLLAARRAAKGYVVAGDRDQAGLALDAIESLVRLNPPLATLDVQSDRVRNPTNGAELAVMSSDEGTSYGILPSLIIVDELTHWTDNAEPLWHSLLSSAAKRESCLLVVISNAGRGEGSSWQWTAREMARESPGWYFSRLDGPVASWIAADRIDELRRSLPPAVFARLVLNQWSSTDGDLLGNEDIESAVTQSGPMRSRPDETWHYVVGLDIGVTSDRSACVTLGTHRGSSRTRLTDVKTWAPQPGGEVDLSAVERYVIDLHRRFRLHRVVFDPTEARLLAQRLTRHGIVCVAMPFTPSNLNLMASVLLQAFRAQVLDLYPDQQLLADLRRLSIAERGWGLRIEAPRDASGHCDSAIALSIALPLASELVHRCAYGLPSPPTSMSNFDPAYAMERFGIQLQR
jgi:phage terminase large subunit-like protein